MMIGPIYVRGAAGVVVTMTQATARLSRSCTRHHGSHRSSLVLRRGHRCQLRRGGGGERLASLPEDLILFCADDGAPSGVPTSTYCAVSRSPARVPIGRRRSGPVRSKHRWLCSLASQALAANSSRGRSFTHRLARSLCDARHRGHTYTKTRGKAVRWTETYTFRLERSMSDVAGVLGCCYGMKEEDEWSAGFEAALSASDPSTQHLLRGNLTSSPVHAVFVLPNLPALFSVCRAMPSLSVSRRTIL